MALRALVGALVLVVLGSGSLGIRAEQQLAGGGPSPLLAAGQARALEEAQPSLPPALHDAIAHVQQEAVSTAPGIWRIQNGRYRATFSAAQGVRFVPRTAAAAYDDGAAWTFRARAATVGNRRTAFSPVAPTAHGHIVEFRRPGLIERYVGGRDGVEQLFVLTDRPVSPGVVRISGEIDVPARSDGGGGLTFHHANGRVTHYSPPIAFDAARRPLSVRVEASRARLDLVLDGAQLAAATFPVTIDPVISAPASAYSADVVSWQDVAFNWRRGEFLVVFGRDEPGQDPSVYLKRFRADGQPTGPTLPVAVSGGWNWKPKVAYNVHADRYLVVWEQTTGPDEWIATIRGLLLDSTATPIGAEFQLNDAPGSRGIEPDVAARNFRQTLLPGDTAWMVTWREWVEGDITLDVRAEAVDSTGAQLGEDQINDQPVLYAPAPQAPSDNASEAPIAFSPQADRFLVVWSDQPDIRGRTISAAGALGAGFAVSDGGLHARLPALEYDMGSQRFLATWSDDGTINGEVLTAAALPAELGDFQITADGAHSSIAAEPGGFLVLYSRNLGGDFDLVHAFVSPAGQRWELGVLTFDATHSDYLGALVTGQQGFTFADWLASRVAADDHLMKSVLFGRFAHFVHGRSGNIGGTPGSDLFLFRQNVSQWRVRTSIGDAIVNHGRPGDIPVLMDIDGDDLTDIGVWRPSDGTFRVLVAATNAVVTVPWGQAGDIPVPGDYSGDGVDDYAVFRQTSGTWLIRDGVTGVALTVTLGLRGDVPVPADYNGDGRTDLGVWRPASGQWFIREVAGGFVASVVFGGPGDIPLQGNFVGSREADQVFFRPSTGRWHRRDGVTGVQTIVAWGAAGDMPMPLDYNADGLLDLTVFRPTTGQWRILDANGAWSTIVNFGIPGDLPAGAS